MGSMGAAPPLSALAWLRGALPQEARAWELHPLALGRQSAGGGPPPTWTVARGADCRPLVT